MKILFKRMIKVGVFLLFAIFMASCESGQVTGEGTSGSDLLSGGDDGDTTTAAEVVPLPKAFNIIGDGNIYVIINNTFLDSGFPGIKSLLRYDLESLDLFGEFPLELKEQGEASFYSIASNVFDKKMREVIGQSFFDITAITISIELEDGAVDEIDPFDPSAYGDLIENSNSKAVIEDWVGDLTKFAEIYNQMKEEHEAEEEECEEDCGGGVPDLEELAGLFACYAVIDTDDAEETVAAICQMEPFLIITYGEDCLDEMEEMQAAAVAYNSGDDVSRWIMDQDMQDFMQSMWDYEAGDTQPQLIFLANLGSISPQMLNMADEYLGDYLKRDLDIGFIGTALNLDYQSDVKVAARVFSPSLSSAEDGLRPLAGYYDIRLALVLDMSTYFTDQLELDIGMEMLPANTIELCEEIYNAMDDYE